MIAATMALRAGLADHAPRIFDETGQAERQIT